MLLHAVPYSFTSSIPFVNLCNKSALYFQIWSYNIVLSCLLLLQNLRVEYFHCEIWLEWWLWEAGTNVVFENIVIISDYAFNVLHVHMIDVSCFMMNCCSIWLSRLLVQNISLSLYMSLMLWSRRFDCEI